MTLLLLRRIQASGILLSGIRSWSGPAVRIGAAAVLSSVAILVLQQLSFRLLAPTIGSSVETWSTIIGVYLLGIAAGNWAGGSLADRASPGRALAWCMLGGSASTALMLGIAEWLKSSPLLTGLPLPVQIILAASCVCFPPAFLLSLITPLAIKRLLGRANDAGRVAGVVYALGSAGSLVGNYLTGFVLIPLLAVNVIGWGVAATLLVLGLPLLLERSAPGSAENCPEEKKSPPIGAPEAQETASRAAPFGPQEGAPFSGRMLLAGALVFTCSFVSGSLESVAFRLLAPLVGSSIFLSTGVIGVVLAGVSLGNYWGGRLASGEDRLRTLRNCLLGAGFSTLAVTPLMRMLIGQPWLDALPLAGRVIVWSFALFFLPSLALGMISPLVIRLTVSRIQDAGRIAGRLYAWSTLGCTAGILATGWLLIEWLGAQRLPLVCGFVLFPLVVIAGGEALLGWIARHRLGTAGFVVSAVALVLLTRSPYDLETKYFSIAVLEGERDGRPVKRLVLDRLVHSEVDLSDPLWLGYPHEAIQGGFTRQIAAERDRSAPPPRVLVIGGGGYTFPKWIEAQPTLDRVRVEVVEIDPGVTEIAHRKLGLARETRIVSHHLDGRQFVKQAEAGAYPLIIQDAVNDFSVPYHLLTREYNELIARALEADGVYLLTVIDSLSDGPLLRAALRTLKATFADVRLLTHQAVEEPGRRCVYVLAAFKHPGGERAAASLARQQRLLQGTPGVVLPQKEIEQLLRSDGPDAFLLTDQYAPVDTLLARVMAQR